MEVIRIIGIGLIGGFISILLRTSRPEFSMMIPVVVTFTVIGWVMPYLSGIAAYLTALAESIGIDGGYMKAVLKMIGIAYLTSISAELCKVQGRAQSPPRLSWGAS